jgi:hypothetical protein
MCNYHTLLFLFTSFTLRTMGEPADYVKALRGSEYFCQA